MAQSLDPIRLLGRSCTDQDAASSARADALAVPGRKGSALDPRGPEEPPTRLGLVRAEHSAEQPAKMRPCVRTHDNELRSSQCVSEISGEPSYAAWSGCRGH